MAEGAVAKGAVEGQFEGAQKRSDKTKPRMIRGETLFVRHGAHFDFARKGKRFSVIPSADEVVYAHAEEYAELDEDVVAGLIPAHFPARNRGF